MPQNSKIRKLVSGDGFNPRTVENVIETLSRVIEELREGDPEVVYNSMILVLGKTDGRDFDHEIWSAGLRASEANTLLDAAKIDTFKQMGIL